MFINQNTTDITKIARIIQSVQLAYQRPTKKSFKLPICKQNIERRIEKQKILIKPLNKIVKIKKLERNMEEVLNLMNQEKLKVEKLKDIIEATLKCKTKF